MKSIFKAKINTQMLILNSNRFQKVSISLPSIMALYEIF